MWEMRTDFVGVASRLLKALAEEQGPRGRRSRYEQPRGGALVLVCPGLRPYVIGVTFEGPVGLVRETTTVEVGEGRNVELEVQLDT